MKKIEMTDIFKDLALQLNEGAFLVSGDCGNPMTVGWVQLGIIWGKPICTVFVRKSRFSHELMGMDKSFTLSIPKHGEMKKELAFCGSKSGRSTDKLAELSLSEKATENGGKLLSKCHTHIVCKTVATTEMDMNSVDKAILDRYYNTNQATEDGDPHTIYFGEIKEAWED